MTLHSAGGLHGIFPIISNNSSTQERNSKKVTSSPGGQKKQYKVASLETNPLVTLITDPDVPALKLQMFRRICALKEKIPIDDAYLKIALILAPKIQSTYQNQPI